MPELIINKQGEIKRFPVDDLAKEFAAFKEEMTSRLAYRRERSDKGPSLDMILYDYIKGLSERKDVVPERGTQDYDEYIDRIWKNEPILAGTVYGMVAKAQTKPWKIEGGRNNTRRAADVLHNAGFSFYKHGWGGFAGSSALDYYTTRIGQVWSVRRRGQEGPITGVEHVDALGCVLTGSYLRPVRYMSKETGQEIRFRASEVIQEPSMILTRETEMGYGFCAVERALVAAQLLVGLHNYDIEKLSNLPPEGIAAITGMTYDEFIDCVTNWQNGRIQDNSKTFPQVLWLLNINNPAEGINVELTPFSSLPEQFDRGVVIEQYVNILANAFGVSPSDIWFMGGGPFGSGREVEMQHLYAKGKGEGEWFAKVTHVLNREFPSDVEFSFDTQDIEEDLNAAQTAKAWVEALMPLVEQSQAFGIPGDRWMRLFAEKGVVPTWFVDQGEPDVREIVSSEDAQRMKMADANDLIAFVWELGKLKETPIITTYRHVDKEAPGRGWWGPPKGTHTAQNTPGGSEGDLSKLSREELESRGYIAVFRGTGPKGLEEMRPSPTGQFGPGIYFYDSPVNARSYAESGGGIITAYVHPKDPDIKIVDVPADMFNRAHKLVVARDASKVIRRGTIPTEKTIINGYGRKAYEEFENTAIAALEEHKEADMPPIRGMPIPEKEVERGTRVTRKAILAEQEIWGEIPELARVLADENAATSKE